MKKIDLIYRHLILCANAAPLAMYRIAEDLGVSVGLVHRASHRMVAVGVAVASKKGVQVTNPWGAATFWAYASIMNAADRIAEGCFLEGPDEILRRVPASGIISGTAAWPEEERPAPFRKVQVYVDTAEADEFLSRLTRSQTAEDANLALYKKDPLFDRYTEEGRAPWPHILADVVRGGEMFSPDYIRDLEDRAQGGNPWDSVNIGMRP